MATTAEDLAMERELVREAGVDDVDDGIEATGGAESDRSLLAASGAGDPPAESAARDGFDEEDAAMNSDRGEGEEGVPSGAEQHRIVDELLAAASELKVGDSWYLIDADWMRRWRDFAKDGAGPPGPVVNMNLVDDAGTLKRPGEISEYSAFELVPPPAWEALVKWHGGGEPVIKRVVARTGSRAEFVETWPLELVAVPARPCDGHPDPDSSVPFTASVGDTPREVAAKALRALHDAGEAGAEFRVHSRRVTGGDFKLVPESDMDDPNGDLVIPWEDGAEIFVECKAGDEWPLDRPSATRETPTRSPSRGSKLLSAAREIGPESPAGGVPLTAGVKRHSPASPASPPLAAQPASHAMRRGTFSLGAGTVGGKHVVANGKRPRTGTSSSTSHIGRLRESDGEEDENRFPVGRGVGAGAGAGGPAAGASVSSPARQSPSWRGVESGRAIWDVESHRTAGVIGLQNLGNTCFMNSALQCLSNTVPLCEYLVSGRYEDDLNKDNPLGTGGELATKFAALMSTMWDGRADSTAPSELKWAIGRFAPQFSGYAQHDSQELLAFLLDGLHEDLNTVQNKKYVETIEGGDDDDDAELAEKSWAQHLLRNRSVIVDLFQGQYKSRVKCPTCDKVSVTFDPFMYLSLPVPNDDTKVVDVVFVGRGGDAQLHKVHVPSAAKGAHLLSYFRDKLGVEARNIALLEKSKYASAEWRNVTPQNSVFGDCSWFAIECEDEAAAATFRQRFSYSYHNAPESTVVYLVQHAVVNGEGKVVNVGAIRPLTVTRGEAEGEKEEEPPVWNARGDKSVAGADVLRALHRCAADWGLDPASLAAVTAKPRWGSMDYSAWKRVAEDATVSNDASVLRCVWGADSEAVVRERTRVTSAAADAGSDDAEVSVYSCLRDWGAAEQLGEGDMWYCPKCKEHRRAFKQLRLFTLPEILVVHLKRFTYTAHYRHRIDTEVTVPLEGVDVRPYLCPTAPADQDTVYDLYAVSNHSGGLGGGHYTACAINRVDGEWYDFNDSTTRKISADRVVGEGNYVLMFQRRSTRKKSAEGTGAKLAPQRARGAGGAGGPQYAHVGRDSALSDTVDNGTRSGHSRDGDSRYDLTPSPSDGIGAAASDADDESFGAGAGAGAGATTGEDSDDVPSRQPSPSPELD
uniref:ubiquitinyl hydrolase 1 n=1 Tax=Bicosoecida sp. CB-2014 TaxID=1486930 RepID=A0A7S1G743_9STRA|mmetsp:Transcript_19377/g.68580  ORF Transcript_19377/g.68580 Transcript_19377/m.68580 type:complete len:1146 (+) Transcript_19377:369-3806(+)